MSDPFDVFGYLQGRNFPTEDLLLYTDEAAALELAEVLEPLEDLDSKIRRDKTNKTLQNQRKAIQKEAEALMAKAKETAITVSLRGIPMSVSHAIGEKTKDNKDEMAFVKGLIAAMIVKVTGPDGGEDSRVWDVETVEQFEGALPLSQWGKLVERVNHLYVSSLAFDTATDAGFLAAS